MTATGNWNVATNWTGSNIGDLVTETVAINNNVSPTILNGSNYTVGNTSLNNNNTLTINSGGTLNVGNSTNARDLTTNNNANISVAGTLVIWGNLQVNNNISWSITGTVIIKGNVVLGNNANITVTGGNLSVDGNFTGNNNTNVNVSSGSISIGGTVNVSGGSNLNGCAGCFSVGGGCTGPSSFCSSSALPIVLEYFKGAQDLATVYLEWATLTEINVDFFQVEHSRDGINHSAIAELKAAGNSTERVVYSFVDATPFAGNNYYRIVSRDFDGSEDYSDVILVRVDAPRSISVSPNPASEAIVVQTNFEHSPGDAIHIYSHTGVQVASYPVDGRIVTINIGPSMDDGLYLLRYISGDNVYVSRFVVARSR